MNTIKITLHEVVATPKEIEINFPYYIKDKNGYEFAVYYDERKYVKVSSLINAIYESECFLQFLLEIGWTPCTKEEFNRAIDSVCVSVESIYHKIIQSQADAIFDEVKDRQDADDAKAQEQLENYLNK